jgi:tRNA(Ile)-lysidine synthase
MREQINNSFRQKILRTTAKFHMLNKGDKVLVGFSGGPDSMALLSFLNELKELLNIKICALHINHRLRANAADKDERFAIQICEKWKVPVRSEKVAVKKYAQKHKLSIEESARVLRYEELSKWAKRLHCNKIALGHNANDNVETVIINLIRGTGLTGLAGIPPKRDNIIRPLIETNRSEILAYIKNNKLNYCHDLTNLELGLRRNYIRHKIIPLLEKLNPNLAETVMRNSQIIRTIDNDITLMAQQAQQTVLNKSDKGRIKLDIKKLLFYNHSIQREIIKEILPTLEFKEIESLLELVNKPTGKRLEINPKMSVCKEYGYLHIAENKQKTHELIDKTWKVNIGENTKIPEIGLELNADITKKIKMSFDNDSTVFDNSQIIPPLSIRLRKPGDRFIPFKGKEKKLKDILIDDKIPVRMRDQLPLLCDANNILWIIGSRRSNIGLITNKTKECLIIKVRKKKLN